MEELSNPNPMLSVIVPIGGFPNGMKPFKSWISSANQELVEIILVVDSDDAKLTDEILLVSKNSRARIQIFMSTARNPGGSRNIGIADATGDWICFWDADDYPDLTNMLEMVSESQNSDSQMAVGAYGLLQENSPNTFEELGIHRAFNALDLYCDPGVWRMAFRRELIGNDRFLNLRMGEDQQFIFQLLTKSPNISFSGRHVYKYVKYQTSQLTKSPVALNDLLSAMKECIAMYKKANSTDLLVGIYKQSLTLLKRARLRVKVLNLLTIIKFWAQNPKAIRELPYCLSVILRHL